MLTKEARVRVLATVCVMGMALAAFTADGATAQTSPCTSVKVRKSVMNLTTAEWNAYANAFRTLMRNGTYDQLAKLHYDYRASAHGTNQFLVWHRAYLREYEEALQKIDPTVTIPYWDWSRDSTAPRQSPIWSTSRFYAPTGIVSSTFLGGWKPRSKGGAPLTRSFSSGYTFSSPTALQGIIQSSTSYDAVRKRLESPAHGNVHMAVGGDFSTMWSANDPLFWSHHAFVDQLYDRWQKAWPTLANTYPYPGNANARMTGLNFTPAQVFNTKTLCYTYDSQVSTTALRTATAVTSTNTATAVGDRSTFTAIVHSSDGKGAVAFTANGQPIAGCVAQPVTFKEVAWEATCSTALLPKFGTYDIRAYYSGDATHAASEGRLDGGQTATLVAPQVNFKPPASLRYGDPLGARLAATATAAGTFTYEARSTLREDAPAIPVTPDVTLPAGAYQLTAIFRPASGGQPARATVPLVVDPAEIVVTPDRTTMVAGERLPHFTYTARGFVNGDGPAVLNGAPVCSVADGAGTKVGRHVIRCLPGVADNYLADTSARSVLVVKAPPRCDASCTITGAPRGRTAVKLLRGSRVVATGHARTRGNRVRLRYRPAVEPGLYRLVLKSSSGARRVTVVRIGRRQPGADVVAAKQSTLAFGLCALPSARNVGARKLGRGVWRMWVHA